MSALPQTAQAAVERSDGRPVRRAQVLAAVLWSRRHEPRAHGIGLLAFILVCALTAFAHVAEDYLTGDPIVSWDLGLARWLHVHSSPDLVSIFKVVTLAGNALVLAGVCLLVGALLLRRRCVNEALLLTFVAAGIELLNAVAKIVFHRPRPELRFVHLDTYSFPSGHAAASLAIYGTLAFVAGRRLRRRGRVLLAVATVTLVLLIGFSRLYLGAHYLSDVLAGLFLGLAWASAGMLVYVVADGRDATPLLPSPVRRIVVRLGRPPST